MPTNQDDTQRRDPSQTQNRPNQGQKGQAPRRDGQQPDRDGQRDRQAGNQQRPDEPEIGDPIPEDKRRPRDRLPADDNVDEDMRRADNENVERERDRPNPRLQ